VQKLEYVTYEENGIQYGKWLVDGVEKFKTTEILAKNDGLDWDDFIKWFSPIPLGPMGIIHFTDFRY
jgi:hypothetical protein